MPGSVGSPEWLYLRGPTRAATASCAYVSALDSSVGAPPMPVSEARTLRPGGIAGPP